MQLVLHIHSVRVSIHFALVELVVMGKEEQELVVPIIKIVHIITAHQATAEAKAHHVVHILNVLVALHIAGPVVVAPSCRDILGMVV